MVQLNTFRLGGIIFKITDIEYVGKKKDFPKRELWLEVPTQMGVDQKSTMVKFESVGDDTASLDFFKPAQWVDMVWRFDGRLWKSPEGKEVLFNSCKIIDMKVGPNPFEEGKELENKPEDLSNTLVSELGHQVKDWVNEKGVGDVNDKLPFEEVDDDLPF